MYANTHYLTAPISFNQLAHNVWKRKVLIQAMQLQWRKYNRKLRSLQEYSMFETWSAFRWGRGAKKKVNLPSCCKSALRWLAHCILEEASLHQLISYVTLVSGFRLDANCPIAAVCYTASLYKVLFLKYKKMNETKYKIIFCKICCMLKWSCKNHINKVKLKP